jgi:hypothetical protein
MLLLSLQTELSTFVTNPRSMLLLSYRPNCQHSSLTHGLCCYCPTDRTVFSCNRGDPLMSSEAMWTPSLSCEFSISAVFHICSSPYLQFSISAVLFQVLILMCYSFLTFLSLISSYQFSVLMFTYLSLTFAATTYQALLSIVLECHPIDT